MSTLKTLGLAIGIAFAASAFAFAQQGNPAPNQQGGPAANQNQQGNPAANAPAGGGGGTQQTSQKTGSAANSQKLAHNQNGHAGTHHRGRRLYSYYHVVPCHVVRHPVSGRLMSVCRR
jgi:hypothetical protein